MDASMSVEDQVHRVLGTNQLPVNKLAPEALRIAANRLWGKALQNVPSLTRPFREIAQPRGLFWPVPKGSISWPEVGLGEKKLQVGMNTTFVDHRLATREVDYLPDSYSYLGEQGTAITLLLRINPYNPAAKIIWYLWTTSWRRTVNLSAGEREIKAYHIATFLKSSCVELLDDDDLDLVIDEHRTAFVGLFQQLEIMLRREIERQRKHLGELERFGGQVSGVRRRLNCSSC